MPVFFYDMCLSHLFLTLVYRVDFVTACSALASGFNRLILKPALKQ